MSDELAIVLVIAVVVVLLIMCMNKKDNYTPPIFRDRRRNTRMVSSCDQQYDDAYNACMIQTGKGNVENGDWVACQRRAGSVLTACENS